MADKTSKDLALTPAQREAGKAFHGASTKKPKTEYDKAQEAFRKNYERLRAERLERDAAKSKEK
ncbi:hypothetical protein [Bradyrhizobium canariense]|uniref:Uncharacterized protein n=1 Tax=Bradyrhizobium canariense TaxID=255045 RepID=A0A1H1UV63_9BRAD|nr:hypothetical protein [Bradyrhizobium canariense]SDS76468.1 hypothetical protein SAMN05444158_3121 [Bradyrhizobium canariense]SDT56623.1 hypothetical protein SAMN05444158_7092 [Bradyrhizobium canariense]